MSYLDDYIPSRKPLEVGGQLRHGVESFDAATVIDLVEEIGRLREFVSYYMALKRHEPLLEVVTVLNHLRDADTIDRFMLDILKAKKDMQGLYKPMYRLEHNGKPWIFACFNEKWTLVGAEPGPGLDLLYGR